jgi:hypothetical protein
MEEEFYASIKLVSGEEIQTKVCICKEKKGIILILDTPVILSNQVIKQLGIMSVKIEPWLKYADDSMCIISMDKVITVSEVKDDETIQIYEKYLKEKNKKSGKVKITPNMGYVSNVVEARKQLEHIFNKFN